MGTISTGLILYPGSVDGQGSHGPSILQSGQGSSIFAEPWLLYSIIFHTQHPLSSAPLVSIGISHWTHPSSSSCHTIRSMNSTLCENWTITHEVRACAVYLLHYAIPERPFDPSCALVTLSRSSRRAEDDRKASCSDDRLQV